VRPGLLAPGSPAAEPSCVRRSRRASRNPGEYTWTPSSPPAECSPAVKGVAGGAVVVAGAGAGEREGGGETGPPVWTMSEEVTLLVVWAAPPAEAEMSAG
jgi:hypothetical protein